MVECIMCGEKPAVKKILNPNRENFPDDDCDGEERMWDVCEGCENFIWRGQQLSMETHIQTMAYGRENVDVDALSKKWMEDEKPSIEGFDPSRMKKK